jgi:hypothetical protein
MYFVGVRIQCINLGHTHTGGKETNIGIASETASHRFDRLLWKLKKSVQIWILKMSRMKIDRNGLPVDNTGKSVGITGTETGKPSDGIWLKTP